MPDRREGLKWGGLKVEAEIRRPEGGGQQLKVWPADRMAGWFTLNGLVLSFIEGVEGLG